MMQFDWKPAAEFGIADAYDADVPIECEPPMPIIGSLIVRFCPSTSFFLGLLNPALTIEEVSMRGNPEAYD